MKLAAEDMDEEAYKFGFISGDDEEASNTMKYEGVNSDDSFSIEMYLNSYEESNSNLTKNEIKEKQLPTLFRDSPLEFVQTLAKETHISLSKTQWNELKIKMDERLRYETLYQLATRISTSE